MENNDKLGLYRSIYPKNSFPQAAWKVDNSMELRKNELLVDVRILNVDLKSFFQLWEVTGGDTDEISSNIIKIVNERGKLHNSVTESGGTLFGIVNKIGSSYPNRYNVAVGDEIISLASLTAIPLRIDKIKTVKKDSCLVDVIGQAIIFENCPIIKVPNRLLPMEHWIAAFEVAGEAAETAKIVKPGDRVILLGADTTMGLICAFAAREKLGSSGKLVGIVDTLNDKNKIKEIGIFDEIIRCDTRDYLIDKNLYSKEDQLYNVVVNCLPIAYTETISLLLAKDNGSVYFASMESNSNIAGLTAEALGKDLAIIHYKGYVDGHVLYLIYLMDKYEQLQMIMEYGVKHNYLRKLNNTEAYSDIRVNKVAIHNNDCYIFRSEKSQKLLKKIIKVAEYDCTVLVYGETGVGKEAIAQIIYENSNRRCFPYIKINCASIPEHLLEAELFGYEKGAFTGSDPKGKKGYWEIADNGILFLDEIGDLPLALQSKLLRVIQEGEIYRVGGIKPIKVNVRTIAATNRDLSAMVRRGEFREDLYYRLNVFPIYIPPLRERRDDILPLIELYMKKYNEKMHTNKIIIKDVLMFLTELKWTGNVRELQNVIQRLLIDSESDIITMNDINSNTDLVTMNDISSNLFIDMPNNGDSMMEIARSHYGQGYLRAMKETEFEIFKIYKDQYKTTRNIAKALGLSQSSVVRKLKKYGL